MRSVAIVGKPNSGKSLLFNKLTGLNQKVTNFPGITVDVKTGQNGEMLISDFPGIYTFKSISQDESIAVKRFVQELESKELSCVLCVLDGTRLSASLRVGLEVQHRAKEKKVPTIFVINMMDEIEKNGLTLDWKGLEQELQSPVIPISAKTGMGLEELQSSLLATDLLLSLSAGEADFYNRSLALGKKYGPQTDVLVLKQTKVDRVLLSPVFGLFFFFLIMLVLFQAIFTWAVPFMDFIEALVSFVGESLKKVLPSGVFQDFVNDALIGGVGSFLVFVPQIFFLTLIVGFLEDSGYLARAAMICHRPLKLFGLSGKSFISLLTGHACAIPAIYAARAVGSPRRRIITIITVPLISCSARLPVYALLIAAFIPGTTVLGGLIGLQGLVFFLLYLLGIAATLLVAILLSKTKFRKTEDAPFLLELPPYRFPHWRPLVSRSLQSSWSFVSKAGFVIFMVTVVVWVLGYFPNGAGKIESSWLATMGHLFEPLLIPLGLDWKYGVAILASFLAREVFVGTLGTMFGIQGAEDNIAGLVSNIQNSDLTLASGVSLLVFYVIALQCASTLAVMRRELNSTKIPVLVLFGYSGLAYLLAWLSYWCLS